MKKTSPKKINFSLILGQLNRALNSLALACVTGFFLGCSTSNRSHLFPITTFDSEKYQYFKLELMCMEMTTLNYDQLMILNVL